MKKSSHIIFILFLVNNYFAQDYDFFNSVDTLIYYNQEQVTLSAGNINPNSIRVYTSEKFIYKESYTYSSSPNVLMINENFPLNFADTFFVSYRYYPNIYKNEYRKHDFQIMKLYENQDSLLTKMVTPLSRFSRENILGKNIQSSGSISRGFSVGTTKDFSLSSGLRLQLSGKLTDDIEIVASLTDENTPIQPDGNTETLEEIDKVFIQIKHKNVVGLFGDIDYKKKIGEFGVVQRKLKGLQADFFYGNSSASVVFASARGKYTGNSFMGVDGVQGPYRLTGENNERNIIIIAGSERVYIDGRELTRGENNDYSLDYSTAEIFFTPKIIITSASRITVDFEYSDRQYQRNYFGINTENHFFDNRLNVAVNFFQEADDQSNPLDIILDEADKNILRDAGDDKYAAVINGAILAEPDSLGKLNGTYTKVDTLINGEQFSFYKYLPGSSTSEYHVSFTFVGNNGDYIRDGIGNYKFVGIGNGQYLPIRFLPLPGKKQLGNIVVNSSLTKNIEASFEISGSVYDANRFSSLNDDNNNGFARKIQVALLPTELRVSDFSLGKLGLTFKDRFVDRNYNSLDRIDNVEFNRHYNLPSDLEGNEHLSEFEIKINPINELNINSTYGKYSKGSGFNSDRYTSKLFLNIKEKFNVNYEIDYVSTELTNIETKWIRQNSSSFIFIDKLKFQFDFIHENREDQISGFDSLNSASLRYLEIIPKLQFLSDKGLEISTSYSYREESFPREGKLELASRAFTRGITANYRTKTVYSNLNFAFRNKNFTEKFKKLGFQNNETVLIKSQNNINIGQEFIRGSLFYEAATEKNSRLEKIFIRVAQGAGNYKYLGDLNGNGIAEENEFEPTIYDGDYIVTTYPTDELFPVVDLKFNTRLVIDFEKQVDEKNFFTNILRAVNTETAWRIYENSRETDISKIYFLNLSSFLKDSTTISGSNIFSQDIYFHKNKRDFSLRFRYLQQKNLNEFNAGIEKSYSRERSMKLRLGLIKEILNETEYSNKTDIVRAANISNRNREIFTDEIKTSFSYRPFLNWEIGFEFTAGLSKDYFPSTTTEIDYNSQLVRINYSLMTKGRVRFELERKEYISNTEDNYIPFEIIQGNVIGKNYLCRINFDYNIGTNLQTTLNYVGRFHGSGRFINTLRAEARAFF